MMEEEVRQDLRRKIIFGINRTAILYNEQRLTSPEKLNFRYQRDHLWFQTRRVQDPGFFRKIFNLSHKSPNFQSNRSFVMKILIRDICAGRFNTDHVSGEAELESFHKKNKIGNYEPRHARRKLNDELNDLVIEIGRVDSDRRRVSYSTAFSIDPSKQEPLFDEAKKLWEKEVQQTLKGKQQSFIESRAIILQEVFQERWSDLIELRKSILKTLGALDDDIKINPYFSALHLEVSEFSPYFIIFCNHLNSICEIFWFMKKNEDKRTSMLLSREVPKVEEDDVEKTLSAMQSIGWDSQRIVQHLMSVQDALMSFGFGGPALKLSKELMVLSRKTELWGEACLEYMSLLRNQKKYKEMLELATSTIENNESIKNQFLSALIKIRHAEALGLNGHHSLAVKELEEMFGTRNQFTGNYTSYIDKINQAFDYVLTEKEPPPGAGLVPVKVSVLENLVNASLRISEYCLAKKYLEELFVSGADYFKRDDALDLFLNFSRIYNKMIFRCNSKQYF